MDRSFRATSYFFSYFVPTILFTKLAFVATPRHKTVCLCDYIIYGFAPCGPTRLLLIECQAIYYIMIFFEYKLADIVVC